MGNAALESPGHGSSGRHLHHSHHHHYSAGGPQQPPHRRVGSDSYPPPSTSANQVRCLNCQRSLVPPASSPNLFRCPCGEVVRTNSSGQVLTDSQPQSAASSPQRQLPPPPQLQEPDDNRQQCQNCFKWLIPPPGAPRFRCTCGNVMVNAALTNANANGASSPHLCLSHGGGAGVGVGTVHARCPRCTQTLVAPPGHTRFRCPCGQMLALTQSRLRCPQCSVVLLPPPGAAQFRCPCGVVLRTPAAQLQVSAQTAADRSAPQATTRDQLDLSNLDGLQLGREAGPADEGGEAGAGRAGGGGGGINKLVSVRERILNRLDQDWARSVDPKTLQVLWRPTSQGPQASPSSAGAPVDESERRAWVRSLRDDGDIVWRRADKVDVYVEHDAGQAKQFARMPPAAVQQAVIAASKLPFGQKLSWFRRQIDRMKVKWHHGHQTIRIKRSNLLETSTHAIMQIPPSSFHQIFRFEFVGEPAKDAGGVAREWYDQLTKTLFNPDFGLFKKSADMSSYLINSSSGLFNDHHLLYFQFAGRLMGKALFDGQLVDAHLARPLYKHMLGHPLVAADLEFVDSELYGNLRLLPTLDEDDIEDLCKTFTVEKSEFGALTQDELKPGGASIDVTADNVTEYTELLVQYYLFRSVKPQLRHLLQGFYEVMPHYLVSVFDSQELEVLLCGLDRVDMADWRKHTEFRGETNELHANHELVQWFFECCEEMDHAERSKLLQWCTGCARVPIEGFVALQSHDGKLCRFALKSVPLKDKNEFPVAHTCFNRIDLPKYTTKAQLKAKLDFVVQSEIAGFGIE